MKSISIAEKIGLDLDNSVYEKIWDSFNLNTGMEIINHVIHELRIGIESRVALQTLIENSIFERIKYID